MTDYLRIEYETTLRDIDAALAEFHIELPGGGAAHRDHGVHLLVGQLRRAEAEVERLRTANARLVAACKEAVEWFEVYADEYPDHGRRIEAKLMAAVESVESDDVPEWRFV